MPHELINEQVDIFQLPSVNLQHKGRPGTQLTIGDLHGNAMKLMFMLVKHGVASNLDPTDYDRLVGIYRSHASNLTQKDLDEFNQILSKIEFNHDCLVRLIGDELADRGNNDYFTLKILEKLRNHHVPVEIIVSNHGIEFVEACELQEDFHSPMLSMGGHAPSMENLQVLVDRGLVSRKEILVIANQCYKPTLRAISYSLSEDFQEITIYSHAGIGLNTIKSLAQKLNVDYENITATALAETIDYINIAFQRHLENNTLNTLYTRERMLAGYNGSADLSASPLEFILWNRFYHHLDRPAWHAGYRLNFVHGHDSRDKIKDNIYNLDNDLGKTESLNRGTYTALYFSRGEMGVAPIDANNVDGSSKAQDVQPTVITLSTLHSFFLFQLKDIRSKARDLRKRGHIVAANRAESLYLKIKDKHFQLKHGKIDFETFQTACDDAIRTARPELEKHRGWKQLLGNVALAILGMGVLYAVALLVNKATTGRFLFFSTDSAQKIDALGEKIKALPKPTTST